MLSYENDIAPLMAGSIACMAARNWPLDSAPFMCDPAGSSSYPDHAHARKTYARLTTTNLARKMPKGGPYWSEEKLGLYRQWMDDGFNP